MTESIVCKRCGLVDDYRTEQAGPHIKAICNGCDQYIKFLPQGHEPTLYFPKYKGRTVKSMNDPEEINYLKWLLGNVTKLDASLANAITEHIEKWEKF